MKNWTIVNLIFLLLFFCESKDLPAQNVTLSGYARDVKTKEALIGVNLFTSKTGTGASTNQYGYYSLTVPKTDTIGLIISYIGYRPQAKKIVTTENLRLDITLEQTTNELNEVVVKGNKNNDNVQLTKMSVIDVPMKSLLTLPVLGGERDILKTIQLLPGVQQGQEGTTGFFVRGGNLDQNLVQLDEATVYNPNHLFGLFSTFNINAINNVKLVKGGFPANYGGRLSSVLEISMKEGSKVKYQVEGGIGLLAANITLQGPIVKEKSSFIISARRSYIDLLMKPFLPKSKAGTTYALYDLNVKANYEIGKNDHLFLSFFNGRDDAAYTGASSLNYNIGFGNSTGTLRWNHLYGSKLFSNTSFIFNDYHLGLGTTQGNFYALMYTAIRDWSGKTDFTFIPSPKHQLTFGASYIYHMLYPAAVSAAVPKKGNRIVIDRNKISENLSDEAAAYVNENWNISDKFSINGGVRVPYFFTTKKSYAFVEPRLTTKISLSSSSSIKASYTQMNQFLHLIPNSTASLPTDIWLSSNEHIKPQKSTQYSLGYYKNFKENLIETSVEVYYKEMKNQVLFKEGTQVTLSTNLDTVLTFGSGKSYGIEFFVKKSYGKLTGWASYTLSKTAQIFPELNFGKEFPFTYDRRHNISVAASYDITKHWTVSADFVFYSGIAFTIPNGKIPVFDDGSLYNGIYYDYTSRNNIRLRPYNRLDVSASYKEERTICKKKYETEWIFGIYNLYSRQNPYFVYLTTDPVTLKPKLIQVSLLPIVPSISFNFKF